MGKSLFVFAQFIVFDSFPAFFLSMVLDFAIKAVLSVSVLVVSLVSRIVAVATLCLALVVIEASPL